MHQEDYFGIKQLFLEDDECLQDFDMSDADMIFTCDDPEEEGFFHIPTKVTYVLDVPTSPQQYLQSLPASKRKNIRRALRDFENEDFEVDYQEYLRADDFSEWLEVYRWHIGAKDLHNLRIEDSKWADDENKGGIFVKKGNKIIGGIVFKRMKKGKFLPTRISIAYSAVLQDFHKWRLNEILNFKLIENIISSEHEMIVRGMDTNFYGHHLSMGLYLFKKSLGFKVLPYEPRGFWFLKINNFSKFQKPFLFFSWQDGALWANVFYREDFADLKNITAPFLAGVNKFAIKGDEIIET